MARQQGTQTDFQQTAGEAPQYVPDPFWDVYISQLQKDSQFYLISIICFPAI